MTATLQARLNELALLATLFGLAAILTIALVLQVAAGEVPCPLCLLERVAMFGICFGILEHVRHGYSTRAIGMSLLWALFLLVMSVRQVLLDICPRPGHTYVGSPVLGLHMPVWSVVIALAVLAAFAAELAVFDGEALRAAEPSPALARIGSLLGLYVIALCVINLVAVVLQCSFGACHTTGYVLLGSMK